MDFLNLTPLTLLQKPHFWPTLWLKVDLLADLGGCVAPPHPLATGLGEAWGYYQILIVKYQYNTTSFRWWLNFVFIKSNNNNNNNKKGRQNKKTKTKNKTKQTSKQASKQAAIQESLPGGCFSFSMIFCLFVCLVFFGSSGLPVFIFPFQSFFFFFKSLSGVLQYYSRLFSSSILKLQPCEIGSESYIRYYTWQWQRGLYAETSPKSTCCVVLISAIHQVNCEWDWAITSYFKICTKVTTTQYGSGIADFSWSLSWLFCVNNLYMPRVGINHNFAFFLLSSTSRMFITGAA